MISRPDIPSMRHVLRQWWFVPLFLALQLIPPYASLGYRIMDWAAVNQFIITHPVKAEMAALFPLFKIVPILLIIGLFTGDRLMTRLFYAYVALVYALAAILQSVSISGRYGWAVCTGNLVTFFMLSILWAGESVKINTGSPIGGHPAIQYWPFLPALLTFWFPVNPQTLLPDFNPAYFFNSGAGLSFCLATPLFLSVLLMPSYREKNKLLACTSFVGLYMGLSNLVLEWVIIPSYWWIGVLHVPLTVISALGLLKVARQIAVRST
jgi:hypothetical protein